MTLSTRKLSPVDQSGRIEQIIKSLQEYIVDGNVQPGTDLEPERELASILRVSRFSLREALRVAQAQGLIEIQRGRRPRVAVPSADAAATVIGLTLRRTKSTFLQLVAARELLESEIANLAALNIKTPDIEMMEKTIKEMEENSGNLALCAEKDFDFHTILVKASGNVVFEIMLAPVAQLLRESRTRTLQLTGVNRAIEGHRLILQRLKERDGTGAATAMRKHLEMAEEDLMQIET
jgi:GntR family transcriptional regulator, transcriptional repressor for pyruvate dehydrogenase complex